MYWPVCGREQHLALSDTDIAAHLIADWIPGIPSASPLDLLGWPGHLLAPAISRGHSFLSMHPMVSGCERQWKIVMSWMLGVACCRKVLLEEGYQWVAPASAFYPNINSAVSTPGWHHGYPSSRLKIRQPTTPVSRLLPDYIAIRPVSSSTAVEWALAESKGTRAAMSNMGICPSAWTNQVHNATVEYDGLAVPIARNLVVATRVNPNAKKALTRRIQVRAWNSSISASTDEFELAKIELIATSLFGICRNLDLIDNANAIAQATRMRHNGQAGDAERRSLRSLIERARLELKERGIDSADQGAELGISVRYRDDDFSRLRVKIERATLQMIETIQALATPIEDVRSHVAGLDREIRSWYEDQRSQRTVTRSVLPEGITVHLDRF